MEKKLAELEAENRQLRAHFQLLSSNSPATSNFATSGPSNSLSFGPPTNPPASYQSGLASTSSTSAANSSPFGFGPSYPTIPSSSSYSFADASTYPSSSNTAIALSNSIAGVPYGADVASNEADASQSLLRLAQRGHADVR